ncbi:uncharacterized protein [Porites lutea]|uniref:uncharacterized protein n=1 Tax=Porites lutea TaxID=51062 RepID=UPI003CC69485
MGTNCEDDIDECDENIHQCNKNAACNNTKGSYSCTCNTGFHGDGYNCTDKCQEIRCGTNATCTNTKGSLRCTCTTGFYGDGYNCTECYTIFDFEDHDLSNWTLTGFAFNNQPTYGDIPSAQRGGHFSNHKGDWWIGTFENRPSPSLPFRYQLDSPQGSMTSPGFSITGKFLRFLIGGGCNLSFQDLRAELIIEGQVVLVQTAKRCAEDMTEKSWDVTSYVGKHAQLRLIDYSSAAWGHLNFDHFQACHKLI